MTVNDCYLSALGILAQRTNDSDLSQFAVGWLNLLLAEALPAENSVRMDCGEAPLPTPPSVLAQGDEIPCCEAIARAALPFGLAAYLYEAADDAERARDYRARFVNALWEASRGVPGGADLY